MTIPIPFRQDWNMCLEVVGALTTARIIVGGWSFKPEHLALCGHIVSALAIAREKLADAEAALKRSEA